MAYIGNAPIAGAFRKLDPITFDSVTMTFQARVGGTAVILGNAQNVLISISGVLQEPGNSYTVAGSNIIFTEAPLVTDSFFGILLGTVGEVTTVTDATITDPKLAVAAVTESKIAAAAVTESKIGTAAVTETKLAAAAVTESKIGTAAVTAPKLAPGVAVSNIGFTPYNSTNPSAYSGNGANTYTGTQTGGNNILTGWLVRSIGSVFVDKGTVATGTVTFDYITGGCQRVQIGGPVTLAVSNFPTTGNLGVLQLEIINGGAATMTFPVINWIKLDGTTTTSVSTYLTNISRNAFQTTGTDFIMIWSRDAGATIYGKIL